MSKVPAKPTSAAVAAFLDKVKSTPALRTGGSAGRLMFAMDATASREPTWDRACRLQGEMFTATQGIGPLEIQLVWYRGFGEFDASPWLANSAELVRRMTGVQCHAGETQIAAVLEHAVAETRRKKVNAVVFVGDCVEENVDRLAKLAGDLGLLGTPVFVFHEGGEPVARKILEEIARLSGGAYCPFDAGSAEMLRDLLVAAATFAVGGRKALEDFNRRRGGGVLRLTHRPR
ncbi:MAG: VWA domain-containing protein [Alphaproteobacteria bacterium]|nr:VWA domain-containing protein [Alphaproteobacteria bacterium]